MFLMDGSHVHLRQPVYPYRHIPTYQASPKPLSRLCASGVERDQFPLRVAVADHFPRTMLRECGRRWHHVIP